MKLDDDVVEAIAGVVQLILERNGFVEKGTRTPRPAISNAVSTRSPMDDEPLWDIDEMVRRLNKPGRSSIYEMCRRRSKDPLPAIRCGRALRFRRRDVEAWLERQRIQR